MILKCRLVPLSWPPCFFPIETADAAAVAAVYSYLRTRMGGEGGGVVKGY